LLAPALTISVVIGGVVVAGISVRLGLGVGDGNVVKVESVVTPVIGVTVAVGVGVGVGVGVAVAVAPSATGRVNDGNGSVASGITSATDVVATLTPLVLLEVIFPASAKTGTAAAV